MSTILGGHYPAPASRGSAVSPDGYVEGEGEWNARKHGGSKRRVWRKIHIGIDEKSLEIRAAEFTTSDVGDPDKPGLHRLIWTVVNHLVSTGRSDTPTHNEARGGTSACAAVAAAMMALRKDRQSPLWEHLKTAPLTYDSVRKIWLEQNRDTPAGQLAAAIKIWQGPRPTADPAEGGGRFLFVPGAERTELDAGDCLIIASSHSSRIAFLQSSEAAQSSLKLRNSASLSSMRFLWTSLRSCSSNIVVFKAEICLSSCWKS